MAARVPVAPGTPGENRLHRIACTGGRMYEADVNKTDLYNISRISLLR